MRLRLISERQAKSQAWLNPDSFYDKRGATTFIFTDGGELVVGPHNFTSHGDIIRTNLDKFKDRYEKVMTPYADGMGYMVGDYREVAERFDLMGRIGKRKQGTIVSFWNKDSSIYSKLLKPCLRRLADRGLARDPLFISTPIHGTVPASDFDSTTTDTSERTSRMADLHRELHLMRGDSKKQAMKTLGVGVGGRPHPMQIAMDKAGLLGPGQKWWAPTSESVG